MRSRALGSHLRVTGASARAPHRLRLRSSPPSRRCAAIAAAMSSQGARQPVSARTSRRAAGLRSPKGRKKRRRAAVRGHAPSGHPSTASAVSERHCASAEQSVAAPTQSQPLTSSDRRRPPARSNANVLGASRPMQGTASCRSGGERACGATAPLVSAWGSREAVSGARARCIVRTASASSPASSAPAPLVGSTTRTRSCGGDGDAAAHVNGHRPPGAATRSRSAATTPPRTQSRLQTHAAVASRGDSRPREA